ncbi:lipase member I-like isoform X2 [Vombatus ursinus]|uniref:Lipase domain-containing protein n=1 Tax=Vombatus ursinus TaxID=29139 RepID=A0A4X2K0L6_VOMUR|nr:lipase member I-like isoform X2 [Vombatus ursinus]
MKEHFFFMKLDAYFTFHQFQMLKLYILLSLMFWTSSGKRTGCLKFSDLSLGDAFIDLFKPRLKSTMIMYTKPLTNCGEPVFGQNYILNTNFNITKKTVWIIHGYRPTGSPPSWLSTFLERLLKKEDVNVIVVDWNWGATTLIYQRAVQNTRKVAVFLKEHIDKMLTFGASLDSFHFVGMSLGAHISGFVGQMFNGQLGRITGLDPAGPFFSGKPPHKRLDYTDAQFVDVIHSDSNALGIKQPLGHIDFYPNGGKTQPGCPKSIFSGASFIKCNHQRAVHLFMTSLEAKCDLTAYPCHSHKDYRNGKCTICEGFKPKPCPKLVYHYILDIVILENVTKEGYMKIKLIDIYGRVEESKIKSYMTTHPIYEEVSVLAGFYHDFKDISKIVLTYSQKNAKPKYPKHKYKIHHIKLRSLTNPERPQLCRYDFELKENVETTLKPHSCTPTDIQTK